MLTTDIEAEIFLNLIGKAWKRLPETEQKSLSTKIKRSLAQSNLPEPLPVQLQHNPVNVVLKGSSAFAVSSIIKPLILKRTAEQFALHFARYQAAQTTLLGGSTMATSQLAINTAQRGMMTSAARYGAVRTVFSFVGPVLWGWFVADVGWKAISTNYSRIIPAIFALAQIRLTRAEEECWEPV